MQTKVRSFAHTPIAASITIGFAIAVFASAVGFFTHLPNLRAPSDPAPGAWSVA